MPAKKKKKRLSFLEAFRQRYRFADGIDATSANKADKAAIKDFVGKIEAHFQKQIREANRDFNPDLFEPPPEEPESPQFPVQTRQDLLNQQTDEIIQLKVRLLESEQLVKTHAIEMNVFTSNHNIELNAVTNKMAILEAELAKTKEENKLLQKKTISQHRIIEKAKKTFTKRHKQLNACRTDLETERAAHLQYQRTQEKRIRELETKSPSSHGLAPWQLDDWTEGQDYTNA